MDEAIASVLQRNKLFFHKLIFQLVVQSRALPIPDTSCRNHPISMNKLFLMLHLIGNVYKIFHFCFYFIQSILKPINSKITFVDCRSAGLSDCLPSHIFTSFSAFQILLLKFLPCSQLLSSNKDHYRQERRS